MEDELTKLLNEKYTSVFRDGYGMFKDTVLPIGFKDYQQDIENLEIEDDDVLVSSFAKSGTTWTQEMVWLILNDLDYEGAKVVLDERSPFLELGAMIDVRNYMKKHENVGCPNFLKDPMGTINKAKAPRCLKTHLPWNLLPLQIQNQVKTPKIIHVLRNPKDVCVSFHHHTRTVEACRGSLEDTFKLFIADKLHYTPYWGNVLSYWEKRQLSNVLIITYEEMKNDLPWVICKVARFLEKPINDAQMEKLIKHLSFREMKKNESVNFQQTIDFVKGCAGDKYCSEEVFMRSGTVGNNEETLREDMADALDKWIDNNTAGTGLKF